MVIRNWDDWTKFARDRVNTENNIYPYNEDALIDLYTPILRANRDINYHSIKKIISALETVKEINNHNTSTFKENELFQAAFDKIVHEGTWIDAIIAVSAVGFISPSYVASGLMSKAGDALNAGIDLGGNIIDYVSHTIFA